MHLVAIALVASMVAADAGAAASRAGPLAPQHTRARAHTKRSSALADHIYLESRLRSKTLRAGIQTDGASLSPRIDSYPHLMVWDLFTPEYNCPDHKSRMGKIGDGGKWVCGQHTLLQQAGCVVYSIGSAGETSFEQEVLARTLCTLHAFDPTLTAQQAKEVAAVVGDRNFHSVGLGVDDGRLGTMPTKKLSTIMKDLGHEWVDVLKMDIEGGEWQVLKGLLAQGPIAAGQVGRGEMMRQRGIGVTRARPLPGMKI